MSTIKRMALASAISMSLLSSVSFAAVSGQMQGAANAQAQAITKAVNVSKATIQCKQATLRIASAAKAQGGKLKGAELRSAIMEATSTAASKFGIEAGCVTPVNVASAASRLTGMYPASGPSMGLAKAGAASGAAGGAAAGGMGALGVIGGLVGIAAVAAALNDDDDDLTLAALEGNITTPAISTNDNATLTLQPAQVRSDGVILQEGTVSGGATGAGNVSISLTPDANNPLQFTRLVIIRDPETNAIISQTTEIVTYPATTVGGTTPNFDAAETAITVTPVTGAPGTVDPVSASTV